MQNKPFKIQVSFLQGELQVYRNSQRLIPERFKFVPIIKILQRGGRTTGKYWVLHVVRIVLGPRLAIMTVTIYLYLSPPGKQRSIQRSGILAPLPGSPDSDLPKSRFLS